MQIQLNVIAVDNLGWNLVFNNNDQSSLSSEFQTHLSPQGQQKIWAIGGGKGGVGKSLVTANLAICLALMGHKVAAIDLDLGGANLHTCLGVPIPEKTLSDYLSKKVRTLTELLTPTAINNLFIISGAQDDLGIANLKQMHKAKLLAQFSELPVDYVLLDLGAGTTFNTIDFFISADQGIITTLPEPTSIENSYRFIKTVYHRKLKMAEELLEIGPLIDQAMNAKLSQNSTPADLINRVIEINPVVGQKLRSEINRLQPKLIINQVRTQSDIDIGFSMKLISKKYFGINLDYVGYLDYDATVWQSVKKRKPLLMEFPNSTLVNNFDRIIHRLLNIN
ncbi:MinD/ParA family protein [Bacteriovorax stolpii]|uniref:ATP-binding protein n=1 Tax=Bacteriovorax stolpii TaxID=960 RepID=A0A2K9NNE7_BACTC|nr:ATP-binding protein [Bacteriovorax stolpii]QDK43019.1 MinD/ParA family protein [Bacteriovorax stolpii]